MEETLHILVVDDEPGLLTGAQRVLRSFSVDLPDVAARVGFTVDTATSSADALSRMEARTPDILLLDHKLPDVSGLDLLRQVAGKAPDMLTIMITAFASLEIAVEATKRGAYDFLAKPFTPAEMKNAIRKAAGRIVFERQARKLAREKMNVRFEFISVLAHELKSPLAAIGGYLRIIRDRSAGNDPPAYDHMLDRSLVRLEGMRKLVNDLLDLTQIESGQKKRHLADVDVREAARACVETFASECARRNIAMSLQSQAPAVMRADKGEIEIILNNLLSNAIKYNRDNGRVEVSVDARDGEVVISVADTGIGMTGEEAARIFTEFARVRNDRTRGIDGSGLGLSIVKKLAQLYDGQAVVDSTPGVGSTFTVTLRHTVAETTDGQK